MWANLHVSAASEAKVARVSFQTKGEALCWCRKTFVEFRAADWRVGGSVY